MENFKYILLAHTANPKNPLDCKYNTFLKYEDFSIYIWFISRVIIWNLLNALNLKIVFKYKIFPNFIFTCAKIYFLLIKGKNL